jgi:hypothetical protein
MADDGGLSRRGFLKLMGGLASLPIAKQLGLDKLLLSEAASAPTSKPFAWGELINLVRNKGDLVRPDSLGSLAFSNKDVYRLEIGNGRAIEVSADPTYSDITGGGDTSTYIDVFGERVDIEGGAFDAPEFSVQIGQNELGNPVGEIMGDAKLHYTGPEDAGDWEWDSRGDFEGQNIDIDFADDFEGILEDAANAPVMQQRQEQLKKIEQRQKGKTNLPATKKQLRLPKLSAIAKFAAKRNLPIQLLQIASQMGGSNLLNWGETMAEELPQAARFLEEPAVEQEITRLQNPLAKRRGGIVSINELVAA